MKSGELFPLQRIGIVFAILAFTLLACSLSAPAASPSAPTTASTATLVAITAVPATVAATMPAPTATIAATTSAPVTGGGCSNPYVPVVAGATWTYSLSGPSNMTINHSIQTVSTGGFTDQDSFTLATGTTVTESGQWKCDKGILTDLTPLNSSYGLAMTKTTYTLSNETGPTFPATFKAGASWSQTYSVDITASAGGVTVTETQKVSQDCNEVGMESVTVKAGTFNAMHVTCKTISTTSIQTQGQSVPVTSNSQSDKYYAPHVGFVKEVDQGSVGGGKVNTDELDLTAYTIP